MRFDYYPFGMGMPGRKYQQNGKDYRYSINGQEKDKELNENITTAEYWEYDARIGRRWNIDPIRKEWESPYASFGANPIIMIDPDGLDWYQAKRGENKGMVTWRDGNKRHKGYVNLGSSYEGYTNDNGQWHWMVGDTKGNKTISLPEVVVSNNKQTPAGNFSMEALLQQKNVTPESRAAYDARPKPTSFDPNPLKTVFWDATIKPLLPIKDVEVYGSAQLKFNLSTKEEIDGAEHGLKWVTPVGWQYKYSFAENKGEPEWITPKYAYLSLSKNYFWDFRVYPYKNLNPSNPSGDIPAGARYLFTLPQYSKGKGQPLSVKTQIDIVVETNSIQAGGRIVGEYNFGNYISVEAAAGARAKLCVPQIIQAIIDECKK